MALKTFVIQRRITRLTIKRTRNMAIPMASAAYRVCLSVPNPIGNGPMKPTKAALVWIFESFAFKKEDAKTKMNPSRINAKPASRRFCCSIDLLCLF